MSSLAPAAVIYQLPTPSPATVGTFPAFKFMVCGNPLNEITEPGFLNQIDLFSNPVSTTDILQVLYNFNPVTQVGSYGAFTVSISNGLITLTAASVPGEVVLPVEDGHFANFIGTTGAIGDLNFRPSNVNNAVVATVDTNYAPEAGFVPSFIGTDGSIGMQQQGSFYKFNGYVFAGDNDTGIQGSCVSSCGVVGGANFFLTSITNPGNWSTALLSAETLSQSAVYSLPDPNVGTATIAVFPAFPSVITPGNILVAGAVDGTIADGGSPAPGAPAVLLTPSSDQTITAFNLTIAAGDLFLGAPAVDLGRLNLFTTEGTGFLQIYPNMGALSGATELYITTDTSYGQDTGYFLPDPHSINSTIAVFPSFPWEVLAGNLIAAGTNNGTLVDSGITATNIVFLDPAADQIIANYSLTVASGNLDLGTASVNGGNLILFNAEGPGNLRIYTNTTGASAINDISITTVNNIGQSTAYYLPDPALASTTIAVYGSDPYSIPPGNLIVAGPAFGTIADGGAAPPTDVVLLTPGADQTITDGQLIIQDGGLVLGDSSLNNGLVIMLNASGVGSFSILCSLTGASADNNLTVTTGTSLGQDTTYVLPDPGATNCTFNVTATSVTAGNILVAGATDGVLVDSGVSVAQLELVSNVIAQQIDIGGSGAGPLTVTVLGLTSASVVTTNLINSSNPSYILTVAPGTDAFDITFDTDPGAVCLISYIAFVNPQ